jgi:SAM-dependent methyltransferase
MNLAYKLAYRIGFTPWERAGEAGQQQLAALLDREEEGRQAPYGKALDLGCGRGLHSLALARRGWDVTGIDVVPQAVEAAQKGAESEDVDVNFVCADVTAMSPADVGKDFEFLLDIGCFHGLRDEQRMAMAASVDAVAADEATLLLLAFQPGRRGPCREARARPTLRPRSVGGASSTRLPPRPPGCRDRSRRRHLGSAGCAAVDLTCPKVVDLWGPPLRTRREVGAPVRLRACLSFGSRSARSTPRSARWRTTPR